MNKEKTTLCWICNQPFKPNTNELLCHICEHRQLRNKSLFPLEETSKIVNSIISATIEIKHAANAIEAYYTQATNQLKISSKQLGDIPKMFKEMYESAKQCDDNIVPENFKIAEELLRDLDDNESTTPPSPLPTA